MQMECQQPPFSSAERVAAWMVTTDDYNGDFVRQISQSELRIPSQCVTTNKVSVGCQTVPTEDVQDAIRMVPTKPVSNFCSRVLELQTLNERASSVASHKVVNVAITGMPGVGKTELVLKFIDLHGNKFHHVIFVNGTTKITLEDSFISLAKRLNLIEGKNCKHIADFEILKLKIYKILIENKTLIIFDNVLSIEDLKLFLPFDVNSKSIFVIVTSQFIKWDSEFNLQLDCFSSDASEQFLLSQMVSDREGDVSQLAELLGHLPLALHVATNYFSHKKLLLEFKQEHFTIDNLIEEISDNPSLFINFQCSYIDEHLEHLYEPFNEAINNLNSKSNYGDIALKILNIMAYIEHNNIPVTLFETMTSGSNSLDYLNALLMLKNHSLIKHEGQNVCIHPVMSMVRRWICDKATSGDNIFNKENSIILLLNILQDSISSTSSIPSEIEFSYKIVIPNYVRHLIKAWSYATKLNNLIIKFCHIPFAILNSIPEDEGLNFIERNISKLEEIIAWKNIIILKIKIKQLILLQKQGMNEGALRLCKEIASKLPEDLLDNNDVHINILFCKSFCLQKLLEAMLTLGAKNNEIFFLMNEFCKTACEIDKKNYTESWDMFLDFLEKIIVDRKDSKSEIVNYMLEKVIVIKKNEHWEKSLEMYEVMIQALNSNGPDIYKILDHKSMFLCLMERLEESSYLLMNLNIKEIICTIDNCEVFSNMYFIASWLNQKGKPGPLEIWSKFLKQRAMDTTIDQEVTLKIMSDVIKRNDNLLGKEMIDMHEIVHHAFVSTLGENSSYSLRSLQSEAMFYLGYGKKNSAWRIYLKVCTLCGVEPRAIPDEMSLIGGGVVVTTGGDQERELSPSPRLKGPTGRVQQKVDKPPSPRPRGARGSYGNPPPSPKFDGQPLNLGEIIESYFQEVIAPHSQQVYSV